MEFAIFPSQREIREQLEQLVEIRLHTDDPKKGTQFQQHQLRLTSLGGNKSLGLPIYVLVDPAEPDSVIGMFQGADLSGKKFAAWLREHLGGRTG